MRAPTPSPILQNRTFASWWDNVGFLWDYAAPSLTVQKPTAQVTVWKWPPLLNERYPLAAFPYPKKAKHFGNLGNFVEGMKSVLNTKSDLATVPGKYVSIYKWDGFPDADLGANTVNNNQYSRALQRAMQKPVSPQKKGDPEYMCYTYKSSPGAIEVMHSCYPPEGDKWPLCDDGGYWFYGVPGTGIFWSIPDYTSGAAMYRGGKVIQPPNCPGYGTLLCANKVDMMLRLYAFRINNNAVPHLPPRPDASTYRNSYQQEYNYRLAFVRSPPHVFYNHPSIDAIVAGACQYYHNREGPMNGVIALYRGVRDYQENRPVKITAFRVMNRSDSVAPTLGWIFFFVLTFAVLGVYVLYVLPMTLFKGFRTDGYGWKRVLAENACVIIGWFILLIVLTLVMTDVLFRGFGYVTLYRLRHETGLSLNEIVKRCAMGTDPKCNGLAMSQLHDLFIENMAVNVPTTDADGNIMTEEETDGFTFACVIMATQPNKQGVWTCEIVDFTRTPVIPGNTDAPFPVANLGLYGHPMASKTADQIVEKPYAFKSGMLKTQVQQPDGYPVVSVAKDEWETMPKCDCDPSIEGMVAAIADDNPPNCIFCTGRLSEVLCSAARLNSTASS